MSISAVALVIGLAAADCANAQAVYVGPRAYEPILRPYEVMSIVRSAGLNPLTRPLRRGATYVVVAADRTGGRMRVVVDAFRGNILAAHSTMVMTPALGHPAPLSALPRHDAVPGAGTTAGGPLLPPPAPNARPASPHPAIASVQPTGPGRAKPLPLPRPRPGLAANDAPDKPTGSVPSVRAPPAGTATDTPPGDKPPAPAAAEPREVAPVGPNLPSE
jgi:hypothetical protein